jgi:type I restriction enzyme S subunit
MLPEGWESRPLGAILDRVVRAVEVEPERLYRELGVRSHGKGVFHKEVVSGKELGEKRVFWVAEDALVLNIVFAWEQAVALTTARESGLIASHRFPMYRPRERQCDLRFLLHYFLSPKGKELLELASPGGAGRNRTLGQQSFEAARVPVPPVTEQSRIADVLETWDASIAVVYRMSALIELERRALLRRLLQPRTTADRSSGSMKDWKVVRLGDVVAVNPGRPGRPPDGKVTFLPMAAVSESGELTIGPACNYEDVCSGHPGFSDGDLLVAKITPSFENGKGALVEGLTNGVGFGSTEFHVLRPTGQVDARLLAHVLQSHEFRTRGAAEMEGSAGQKRISSDFIRTFKFLCPSELALQQEVANLLDLAGRTARVYARLRTALQQEKRALSAALLTGGRRVRNSASGRAE